MAKAQLEVLRSLAFGSISGSYAAVGAPLANPCRLICITNNTDGDMLFSIDGTNDHLFVGAGSFKLFDVQTNSRPVNEDEYVFRVGTQFYVKESTSPTTGDVYIEALYAS
jgi:hypothetical protein